MHTPVVYWEARGGRGLYSSLNVFYVNNKRLQHEKTVSFFWFSFKWQVFPYNQAVALSLTPIFHIVTKLCEKVTAKPTHWRTKEGGEVYFPKESPDCKVNVEKSAIYASAHLQQSKGPPVTSVGSSTVFASG